MRLARLDLLERLLAVARRRDDLDAALGEELGDRLEHGRMVVGDDAGDGWVVGGVTVLLSGIPDSGDGSAHTSRDIG